MIHDYESLWRRPIKLVPVIESFKGTDIVRWHGAIERQLTQLITDYEDARNYEYVDKLNKFRQIWRNNAISGSINREVLDVLLAASDMLAIDPWPLENYFSTLRDSLRVLIASEEELPRMSSGAHPMSAGGGGSPSLSKMKMPTSDFGPEKEPPTEPKPEGEEGQGEGAEGPSPSSTAAKAKAALDAALKPV